MSTTAMNFTPVFVSKPYAARRSSTACRSPKSPVRRGVGEAAAAGAPPVAEGAARRARVSKMSRVLLRRRENCKGVRRGARVLLAGS
ncbi:hypothetical protein PC116_g34060 [Phytophthora cactorum]|nr:hypothetical protein PC116_g34060 [Phytophthora cactorum]